MIKVFLGLGSNLNNPVHQVKQAITRLSGLVDSSVVLQSSLYRSTPLGPPDQDDYVNAVIQLETTLNPDQLLMHTQAIENDQGRRRNGERWGPRTLDIDLLLYGNLQIVSNALTVPHYGIADRAFVLYPLAEIAPDLSIPGLGPLKKLLQQCKPVGLEKLTSSLD